MYFCSSSVREVQNQATADGVGPWGQHFFWVAHGSLLLSHFAKSDHLSRICQDEGTVPSYLTRAHSHSLPPSLPPSLMASSPDMITLWDSGSGHEFVGYTTIQLIVKEYWNKNLSLYAQRS